MLKKTNQTGFSDSKFKSEGLTADNLLKKFADLSIQAQTSMKARNTKINAILVRIEKDLKNYNDEDELARLNKQLNAVQSLYDEAIDGDEKVQLFVRERIRASHHNFQTQLDDLKTEGRDIITGFNKETEKELFKIDISLKKQQKAFHENIATYDDQLREGVEYLKGSVNEESEERELRALDIQKEVIEQLYTFEEDINANTALREQTEEKIKDLIDHLNSDLDRRIIEEKKEREDSNNSLLNLLEQACAKLEQNFLN